MGQMHHSPQSDIHLQLVDSWEKNNANGLSADKQAQLFGKAVHAVEQRTLLTLSSATLMVILDRVLKQSKKKYPMLSDIKIEAKGMNFDPLINSKEHKSEDLLEGLRYLLVELLGVLGSITADILTPPLHRELFKVTGDFRNSSPQNIPEER